MGHPPRSPPLSGGCGSATTFTAPVATFTDSNPTAPLGSFTAPIIWGDATTSLRIVTRTGGPGTTFTVTGTPTYAAHGTYTVGAPGDPRYHRVVRRGSTRPVSRGVR